MEPGDVRVDLDYTDLNSVELTSPLEERTMIFIHQNHMGMMVDETDYNVWRLEGVEGIARSAEPIDKDRKIEMEL